MIVQPYHYTTRVKTDVIKDEQFYILEKMKREAERKICLLRKKQIKDKVLNKGMYYVRDFKLFSEYELTMKQLDHIALKPKFQLPKIKKELYTDTTKPKSGVVVLDLGKHNNNKSKRSNNNSNSEMKGRTLNKSLNCYFNPRTKRKAHIDCSYGGSSSVHNTELTIGK